MVGIVGEGMKQESCFESFDLARRYVNAHKLTGRDTKIRTSDATGGSDKQTIIRLPHEAGDLPVFPEREID